MNANVKMKIVDENLYNEAAWLMELDPVELEDIDLIAIVRNEEDYRGIDLSEMLSLLVEQVFYIREAAWENDRGWAAIAFSSRQTTVARLWET